jgi:hypothetical protein
MLLETILSVEDFMHHINLASMIIHGLVYGIIYRLLRGLSWPELLFLGAGVVVAVIIYNRSADRRRSYW